MSYAWINREELMGAIQKGLGDTSEGMFPIA